MPFTQGPWSHIAEAGARAEAGAGLFKQLEHTT